MSTMTATAPLLDRPESRFPLAMDTAIPRMRDLYLAATRNQWDPQREIDWDALDPDSLDDEHREAARNWWSRRGWGEYGAISESPTLSVRFTQDRLPVEMALFFALRTQEEAPTPRPATAWPRSWAAGCRPRATRPPWQAPARRPRAGICCDSFCVRACTWASTRSSRLSGRLIITFAMEAGYTGIAQQQIPCIWQRNCADVRESGDSVGRRRPSAF